jgi:hypothetical protein
VTPFLGGIHLITHTKKMKKPSVPRVFYVQNLSGDWNSWRSKVEARLLSQRQIAIKFPDREYPISGIATSN